MIRSILACAALCVLTGCETARSYMTCDNARYAVVMAERVVERVCKSDVLSAR